MVLDNLKPAGWPQVHEANQRQIDALLEVVNARTGGSLSRPQMTGVSVVAELMGKNRVQFDREMPPGQGRLLLGNYDTQTGDLLPELDDGTKQRIREVAELLNVEAIRLDPKTERIVRV